METRFSFVQFATRTSLTRKRPEFIEIHPNIDTKFLPREVLNENVTIALRLSGTCKNWKSISGASTKNSVRGTFSPLYQSRVSFDFLQMCSLWCYFYSAARAHCTFAQQIVFLRGKFQRCQLLWQVSLLFGFHLRTSVPQSASHRTTDDIACGKWFEEETCSAVQVSSLWQILR